MRTLLSGFLAGICVSIGGCIYLNIQNNIVAAIFFSIALLMVCYLQLHLYTGKIGFVINNHHKKDLADLGLMLIGNMVGTEFVIDNKEYTNVPYIINDTTYKISLVNSGVWHGIVIPEDFEKALKDMVILREYPEFQEWLNIDIVKITEQNVFVKTLERGVGYTKACGTGSCSSFITCYKLNKVNNNIIVKQELGDLNIYLEDGKIYMVGPACKVADIFF